MVRYKSKIIISSKRRWSSEEIKILNDNYQNTPLRILKTKLNRSSYSIWRKAPRINLKKIDINICDKNGNWKGDNAQKKGGFHDWIRKRKNKPFLCEYCHKDEPYDLANISGEYKRDINDFEWLCRRCHMNKDGRLNNLKQFNRERNKYG